MHCRQVRGMFPAHFNKELSESDRRTLEAHLGACSSCHTEWRTLYRVEIRLLRVSQSTQVRRGPSDDFTARVMLGITVSQQQGMAGQQAQSGTPLAPLSSRNETYPPGILPFGSLFRWGTGTLGVWNPTPGLVLSGALLVLLPIMVAVLVFGLMLTQPSLATQVFVGGTNALASLAAGIYSLISALSVLANNQFLLAGVAGGYVALALLWFRLMRHPGHEEVES